MKKTIEIHEEAYALVVELLDRLGIPSHQDIKLHPDKDASLISALGASEKESLEHPETCTDWIDILEEWDEEEVASNNPPL